MLCVVAHLGLHVSRERLHWPQRFGESSGGRQLKHNALLRLLHAVCLATQRSAALHVSINTNILDV